MAKQEQKTIIDTKQILRQKKLNVGVKERTPKTFKERVLLKKLIFVEKALTYASLRRKIEKDFGVSTTRQYLYGIVSGRLTPSFEFATVLCKALDIKNVYTLFEPSEIYFPSFQSADEPGGNKNELS
jgi:hypothetical protein